VGRGGDPRDDPRGAVALRPRRGEVWWAEMAGAGRRPVLVLTRDEVIPLLHSVLVAPATRTVRSIPTEVPLDEDEGMPAPCALSLDNVTPVPKSRLRGRITAIGPRRMDDVCAALAAAVACSR
jgi:mRNA interferase MazF